MSFDDSVKERIREATDIVELVSQYVPLRRSGRNYVGHCPWHDDTKPSLQVNPQRQSFKCWVCDLGGDVFSFVMKVENVDFKEALEILADKAGIALPKNKTKRIFVNTVVENAAENSESGDTTQTQPQEISRQSLFKATEWLAQQYHQALLHHPEAEIARKYLEDRHIEPQDVEKFQIGYAPMESDWLAVKVKRNPRQLQMLALVGNLVDRRAENEHHNHGTQYYDRFRGRVLFPIRDTQNRTVAFGGRVIPNSPLQSPAKYVNSPETPLFSKHRMLYGLDIARHKMAETRRALIMEGYTDTIIAHQFGFGDAVAVLGTALGAEHIRILKRYVDKMVLVLDGDEAGRKRADQVLELFVAQGVDMSILTLPAGMDPAEFLEQHGSDGFRTLLETETVDVLEHAFRSVTRNVDLKNDIVGSSRALDSLLGIIAQSPNKGLTPDDPIRIRIDKMIQNLSHRFLVTETQIRQRLREKRRHIESKSQYNEYDHEPPSMDAELWNDQEWLPDGLEREMLELWLADATTIYEFWEAVPPERCRSPITRLIYQKCNELIDRNLPATFDRLMTAFDDPNMKSFLVDLDESGREKRKPKRDATAEPPDAYRDELNDLQESLHNEIEEDKPLSDEWRERLVREILDGFDRRDDFRNRLSAVNELRGDSLTEEEKSAKLLELQAKLQKQQKKRIES